MVSPRCCRATCGSNSPCRVWADYRRRPHACLRPQHARAKLACALLSGWWSPQASRPEGPRDRKGFQRRMGWPTALKDRQGHDEEVHRRAGRSQGGDHKREERRRAPPRCGACRHAAVEAAMTANSSGPNYNSSSSSREARRKPDGGAGASHTNFGGDECYADIEKHTHMGAGQGRVREGVPRNMPRRPRQDDYGGLEVRHL